MPKPTTATAAIAVTDILRMGLLPSHHSMLGGIEATRKMELADIPQMNPGTAWTIAHGGVPEKLWVAKERMTLVLHNRSMNADKGYPVVLLVKYIIPLSRGSIFADAML